MLRILMVTARLENFRAFAEALAGDPEVRFQQVGSEAEALSGLDTYFPHLVVIDTDLPDANPLGLVHKVLRANALVSTAVVSPLSEEEFHEESEGLGVLSKLPPKPGGEDAIELLQKLRQVRNLSP